MDSVPALQGEALLDKIEDADFRMGANPTNTIILPTPSTRGEKILHLTNQIPANDYGLPLFYIRSDLLDWTSIEAHGHLTQDDLQAAAEVLEYHDGYPTLRSGSPFWAALPHEPYDRFTLFQEFIRLNESEGIRLIDSLAKAHQIPLERIREMSLEYFWSSRARAYDLFIVAAETKKREVRTRKTENAHFEQAGKILEAVVDRINDNPELIAKMEATDLFNLFEQMVKVQRLSLGLTGANASTRGDVGAPAGTTVEFILRQLTQNSGLSDQSQESFQQRLAILMSDPNAAMQAQELVIRATTGNQVHKGTPDA